MWIDYTSYEHIYFANHSITQHLINQIVEFSSVRSGPMRKSDPTVPWKPLLVKKEAEKKKTADTSTNILKKFTQKKTSKIHCFCFLFHTGFNNTCIPITNFYFRQIIHNLPVITG